LIRRHYITVGFLLKWLDRKMAAILPGMDAKETLRLIAADLASATDYFLDPEADPEVISELLEALVGNVDSVVEAIELAASTDTPYVPKFQGRAADENTSRPTASPPTDGPLYVYPMPTIDNR
jgi:hypothetical protein